MPSTLSGYEGVPQFGGPTSVGSELEEEDEVKESTFRFDGIQRALAPYFDWKARMNEEHGLALGGDYTAIFYDASEDLGDADINTLDNKRSPNRRAIDRRVDVAVTRDDQHNLIDSAGTPQTLERCAG